MTQFETAKSCNLMCEDCDTLYIYIYIHIHIYIYIYIYIYLCIYIYACIVLAHLISLSKASGAAGVLHAGCAPLMAALTLQATRSHRRL